MGLSLIHICAVAQAGQQLLDAELLHADAVHGADEAVKVMIQAVVFPGALKGLHVPGGLHHADDRAVPLGAGADGAELCLGVVLADAEMCIRDSSIPT